MTSLFISGGASNEIFEIRRGDFRAVLRRPPRVVPKGRNETMLREYRVLDALNGTDVPHPEAYAACTTTQVIGSSFYLMSLVDGWSPMNMDGWPAPFDTDLDARYGLGIQLVDGIARLARVDWRAQGPRGVRQARRLPRPPGGPVAGPPERRPVPRHPRPGRGRRVAAEPQAEPLGAGHHPRRLPVRQRDVLPRRSGPAGGHGRLGDVDGGRPPARPGLGDERMDRPGRGPDRGYVDCTGMPSRAEMLDHYATVSGRSVEEIDYYVILARFKLAIVLEAGYARVVKGEADNPTIAAFGQVVLDTMAAAAELASTTPLGR